MSAPPRARLARAPSPALARALALPLALSLASCGRSPPPPPSPASPSQRARVVRLRSPAGEPRALLELASEPGRRGVVVHLFTAWCQPCLNAIPALNALQSRAPQLKVVGVCVEGRGCPHLDELRRLFSPEYDIYLGDERLVRGDGPFGEVLGLPTTLLIDAEGRLVARAQGAVPVSLFARLGAALPAPAAAPEPPAPLHTEAAEERPEVRPDQRAEEGAQGSAEMGAEGDARLELPRVTLSSAKRAALGYALSHSGGPPPPPREPLRSTHRR